MKDQCLAPDIVPGISPPRVASVTTDQLLSLDDMEDDTFYPMGCFARWLLPRGRRLGEALANDPEAPRPVVHPKAVTAKCFTRAMVKDYLARLDCPVDLANEVSRIAADMERRTRAAEARIANDIQMATMEGLSEIREEARQFVKDFLAKSAGTLPPEDYTRICGVYFLRRFGAVVYVGQSVNILARVNQHVSAGKIEFDEVEYLRCSPDDLNDYEGFFIRFLRPPENGRGTDKNHAAPSSKLWDRFSRLRLEPMKEAQS